MGCLQEDSLKKYDTRGDQVAPGIELGGSSEGHRTYTVRANKKTVVNVVNVNVLLAHLIR